MVFFADFLVVFFADFLVVFLVGAGGAATGSAAAAVASFSAWKDA